MFRRVTLLALVGMLFLGLASCGPGPAQETAKPAAEAPPPPKPVEQVPMYELTKDAIMTHPDWTSRNITILGVKLGDVTRNVEKNLGKLDNTRTLPEDYLTIYQNNGIFVYTVKLTGKAHQVEIYKSFADKVADPKLKRLLTNGDAKYMRELFGMEEKQEENTEDNATEYSYDSRGFRFVQYKVGGQVLNALRLNELKKASTT